MILTRWLYVNLCLVLAILTLNISECTAQPSHPNLVITSHDVELMRQALKQQGRFSQAYHNMKQRIDQQMTLPFIVPVPKDGGGGYTHERHKRNYQLMFEAATLYQLSQEKIYAEFVRDMLLEYAQLYPSLTLHPKRKIHSQNPGKLFWQSLNEAVWMVYTIQAYDLIHDFLSADHQSVIEKQLLKPVALFLSEGQPSTFNKVHNHGTWATTAVGMAGFVMDEPEWVEKALYDLNKSGQGGFLKQLDQLFSPQGYYTEGPYYQRYALMPFITFAKAIHNNQPQRGIFQYRDQVLLKAIETTIQLSYAGLFFPINDAIKSKGIDTAELVNGVTVAYGLTEQAGLLDIAQQQNQILLTGDGLKVANALDKGLTKPYLFKSTALGDGSDGKQGALVIMRGMSDGEQTLLFKPAAQGLGHGHFDKLTWQFYDKGQEIVSDYGAARFLNVEAKYGGRYLPENESYAKQTVAHNTVVIDEKSHFNGQVSIANQHAPDLNYFSSSSFGTVANAEISSAYQGVQLNRTLALVNLPNHERSIGLDLFEVSADSPRKIDLPLHYQGQLIATDFKIKANSASLYALGKNNGYQHLWLKGSAQPNAKIAQVSWLNTNGRFYTHTSLTNDSETFLFTQIGANDPNFNLRNEQAFIRRVEGKTSYQFISILEPHGEYNPNKEYTLQASSSVTDLTFNKQGALSIVRLEFKEQTLLIVINQSKHLNPEKPVKFNYQNRPLSITGRLAVFKINNE